ncbi:MAG: hypothetical protein AAF662_14770 [Pseudomonadota bacterium]
MSLTSGGSSANLPEGWVTRWGWPIGGNTGAIWVGREPASDKDIQRIGQAGFSYDGLSLVGVLDEDWDATQYLELDREELEDPWEKLSCPGGLGSHTYQFQHIPEGIDKCMPPRKWVFYMTEEGLRAKRSQGREYCHKVDLGQGQGHWQWHLGPRPGSEAEGKEFYWDPTTKLHRVA